MKQTRLALRYAKALFDLAIEQNILEKIMADMKLFSGICSGNIDLRLMLANPIIKSDKKQSIFIEIFEKHVTKLSLEFILLITRKRREVHLQTISEQFLELYYQHENIKIIHLKTAVEIDNEIRTKIKDIMSNLTNANIELVEKTDPSVIGGFVITMDDKQFDASISEKLNKLSKEIIN